MSNHTYIKRVIHTTATIVLAIVISGSMQPTYSAKNIRDPLPINTTALPRASFSSLRTINDVATTTTIPHQSTATEIQPEMTGDSAKMFIYMHESNNDPTRMNSIGCYGIGQDCNGIVYNLCGADYTCQDEYFTNYMKKRYGSWENAKAFWLACVPINGHSVGNWW